VPEGVADGPEAVAPEHILSPSRPAASSPSARPRRSPTCAI
jgi:hypothetical protein